MSLRHGLWTRRYELSTSCEAAASRPSASTTNQAGCVCGRRAIVSASAGQSWLWDRVVFGAWLADERARLGTEAGMEAVTARRSTRALGSQQISLT